MNNPSVWKPNGSATDGVPNLAFLSGVQIPVPEDGITIFVTDTGTGPNSGFDYQLSLTSGATIDGFNVVSTFLGGVSRWIRTASLIPTTVPSVIVYKPSGVTAAPVYATWAEVQAVIAAATAPLLIVGDDGGMGGTVTIPGGSGVTDCKFLVTLGQVAHTEFSFTAWLIGAGAQLLNLVALDGGAGATVRNRMIFAFGGVDPILPLAFTIAPGGRYYFNMRNIEVQNGGGTAHMFETDITTFFLSMDRVKLVPGSVSVTGFGAMNAYAYGNSGDGSNIGIPVTSIPDDSFVNASGTAALYFSYDTGIFGGATASNPIPSFPAFTGFIAFSGMTTIAQAVPIGSGFAAVSAAFTPTPGTVTRVDASGGSFACILPPVSSFKGGQAFSVKFTTISANTVNFTPDGADTIDGVAGVVNVDSLLSKRCITPMADPSSANWFWFSEFNTLL